MVIQEEGGILKF